MATERRLIEANALMDDVEMDDALYACLGAVDDVRFIVDSQPTVDAVEVVRCKDCKYLYPGSDFVSKHCSLIGIPTDDDDYCSHGENKNDDLSL